MRLPMFLSGVLLACLLLTLPIQAASPEEVDKVRKEWKEVRLQRLKAEARWDAVDAERRVLKDAPLQKGALGKENLPPDHVYTIIQGQMGEANGKRNASMKARMEETNTSQEEAQAEWGKVMDRVLRFHTDLSQTEIGEDLASLGVPLWDFPMQLLVGMGFLVLFLSILLAYHEVRVAFRKEWRAGRYLSAFLRILVGFPPSQLPVAMLLLLFAITTVHAADAETLDREKVRLFQEIEGQKKALKDLEEKIKEVSEQTNDLRKNRTDALRAWYAEGASPQDVRSRLADVVTEQIREGQNWLLEMRTATNFARRLREDAERERGKVNEQKSLIVAKIADRRDEIRWVSLARIAVACGFGGLSLGIFLYANRHKRKHLKEASRTCPRCLKVGTLSEKASTGNTKLKQIYCSECIYEFWHDHLKYPRLCFPTVGIRASGKTHWLVSAYSRIKNAHVPESIVLDRAPSLADEKFDKLIEIILESQTRPGFTNHHLPDPLTFRVTDGDRKAPSSAMVSLFDFSGELMNQNVIVDGLKRRSMCMDGIILFLDPTQVQSPPRKPPLLSLKEQVKTLADYAQELRITRGLDTGIKVPMPVAVCVSKIDMLVKESLGEAARPWLADLRKTMGEEITLKLINKRSLMCEEMLGEIFPGWNLTKALRDTFGTKFRFFPMSPVGLYEPELGMEDLSQRTNINPFSMLEPVLWLTYMHGYQVLR